MYLFVVLSAAGTQTWTADRNYAIVSITWELSAAGQACCSKDPSLLATSMGGSAIHEEFIDHFRITGGTTQLMCHQRLFATSVPVYKGEGLSVRMEVAGNCAIQLEPID